MNQQDEAESMTLYAIRNNRTKLYLPYRKSRKGFTADEPTQNCIPRLFKKKNDANIALRWWLEGKWSAVNMNGDHDINVERQVHRKAEDMEIVTLFLNTDYNL